jgi:hypothetical protein
VIPGIYFRMNIPNTNGKELNPAINKTGAEYSRKKKVEIVYC